MKNKKDPNSKLNKKQEECSCSTEKAIEDYNELVKDYNKDIEDEEQYLELIEELHIKNKVEGFIEDIKDNKAMTAVTVLAGTAFGGLLLYGIYKFISKFFKWLKR